MDTSYVFIKYFQIEHEEEEAEENRQILLAL